MVDIDKAKREAVIELANRKREAETVVARIDDAIKALDEVHTLEDANAWEEAHGIFDDGLMYIRVE